MLKLDQTTRKLQAVLSGAVTTNQLPCMVSYSDDNGTTYVGGTQLTNTNSTTAVDICAAPGASTVRDIDYLSIRNRDTAAATVTVMLDDNTTDYEIVKAALAVGDQLIYTHGDGWRVLDTSGQLKTSATGGGGISDGDKGDITVSGSGATWTIDNDVVTYAKMQDVSATDMLLGRSTAGAGDTEEIACTAFARSILDDANEATFKATVNLEIGTDVQAYDADLSAIAALAKTDGNIIVGDGAAWVAESGATARTSLGLGTGDSPQFTGVNLGHASDTTLTRVSAGVVAVEGTNVVLAGAVTTDGITMSTARLLGRTTAATGAVEEITVGSGLSLSAGSLTATGSTVIVQVVEATPYTTAGVLTTAIPIDSTIPQNTEGTELTTVAITPTSASNRLRLEMSLPFIDGSGAIGATAALFQDSTANAIALSTYTFTGAGYAGNIFFSHEIAAGTTSTTTFKLRAGPSVGTLYVNRKSGGETFGGISAVRLRVTEIAI